MGLRSCFLLGFAIALQAGTAYGQAAGAPVDPVALVRRACEHRIEAGRNHRPLRYLLHKKDERLDSTKEIIETRDGDVARLVAIDGKPLNAQANRVELDRLQHLAEHPELQAKRHRSEQKDEERVNHMMALLPDAVLYQFAGMTPCATGECYRLTFVPNPKFVPAGMEEDFFRGMAGDVLIDKAQERLVRLEAHVVAEVDFGWGILGKLNKGGTIVLEQRDIGGGDWELTGLRLDMTGKLLWKPLKFQVVEETSGFQAVDPGMGYRRAIELLEKTGQ
jgi:hypothetical protein